MAQFNNHTNILIKAGDTVSFKRGDVFYGDLTLRGGMMGKRIIYNCYGRGANPIFSGFTKLTSWTLLRGSIFYASLNVPILHGVTLDGVVKGMGRYPNSGFLAYTSHSANTSITGATVGALPFDPSGAEVVIRKYRWIWDRQIVTSRSFNTLNYSATRFYGNNNGYDPVDGNGYFIQNHLGTLDKEGEWFYDKIAKRLYMHFGSGSPAGRTVKASTVAQIVTIGFNNLDFEGGNYAVVVTGSNITFNDCNFRQQGASAVYGENTNFLTFKGGSISDALNCGIKVETGGTNTTIMGMTLSNIGTIVGMGQSGDGGQRGISIFGNNTTISGNHITNTGYHGINFIGNNVLIENNFVNTFCTVMDDGGGIYTYSENMKASNRIIKNNIIVNAIGAYKGAEAFSYEAFGKAAAIYLDGFSNNVEVNHNTLANGEWGGIFINGNKNNSLINNYIYAFKYCIHLAVYTTNTIRGLIMRDNTLIARTTNQKTLYLEMNVNDNPSLYGMIDNNMYARPIDDNKTILVNKKYLNPNWQHYMTLQEWKAYSSQDALSRKSSITTRSLSNIRFDYNYSLQPSTVRLVGTWKNVENRMFTTRLVLAPYTGLVLVSTKGKTK